MAKRFQAKNPENIRKIQEAGDSSKPQIIRTLTLTGTCSQCTKLNATAIRVRGNPGQKIACKAKASCGNCDQRIDLSITTTLR